VWTENMVKELKKIHSIHRAERDSHVVGGVKQFSHGKRFAGAKAAEHIKNKNKFFHLRNNEGFHAACVRKKVQLLGLQCSPTYKDL